MVSNSTMFCPDFPFAYDDWVNHPAGLGSIPESAHGTEVAVVGGGISGLVTAYELMKLGVRPVVYEADQLGGRMRSITFDGFPGSIAEMGAMRFPPSATTLFHYIDELGLESRPFPNPLSSAASSTVVNLNGVTHYARTVEDLPEVYREVSDAWEKTLQEKADFSLMEEAIRHRDIPTIKALWNNLVTRYDNETFYGFLSSSPAFSSFKHREIFGQVGFGCGGWDTDFPNSMLEILRVVYTEADAEHLRITGGCQQVPLGIWFHAPRDIEHWPRGTSLASLHGTPRPAVTGIQRDGEEFLVEDAAGETHRYAAVVFAAQNWNLLSRIRCDESLLSQRLWTAVERTHYMGSSKTFVVVDRPFWLDKDPDTGRDVMSMTLTDRLPRGTYLFDDGPDKPGVICLSYTWNDDSSKVATLTPQERVDTILGALEQIYPGVDIRSHIVGEPVAITWESEPYFMGAFKSSLPGGYRYQRELFTQFMQDEMPESERGFFMSGDDVSWIAGFAESAVTTGLNAVWGVMRHLGGGTHADNPGPGDLFDEIAPIRLPDN